MKLPEYIKPLSDQEIELLEEQYLPTQSDRSLIKKLPKYSDEEIEVLDSDSDIDHHEPIILNKNNDLPIENDLIDLAFNEINFEKIIKEGYPNIDVYRSVPGQHNLEKWMSVVKEIFATKNGNDKKNIFLSLTKNWNPIEKTDFSNWLKYYQEKNHLKYKQAQSYYMIDDRPGYFVPNKGAQQIDSSIVSSTYDSTQEDVSKQDRINKVKFKILSRLDSAEKLVRSKDGIDFAGNESSTLLDSIYNLKKTIQTLKKASVSTVTYQDLIIRQANICSANGFYKSASFLNKIADDVAKPASESSNPTAPVASAPPPTTTTPADPPVSNAPETPSAAAPPDAPMQGSGNVGGLPSTGPGNVPPGNDNPNVFKGGPPSSDSGKKRKGVKGFIEAMKDAGVTQVNEIDKNKLNDNISSVTAFKELNQLISFAQEAANIPTPSSLAPAPAPAPAPAATSPDIASPSIVPTEAKSTSTDTKNIDLILESALNSVTVSDVINKLESLSKIFKVREIPRQLAIVDMMLDRLGLAALFPSLAEATNKALDSNNYISIRLDEVLTKLHGVVKTKDLELTPVSTLKPEAEEIKRKLEEDTEKEKARKQIKKDLENQALENQIKETPEINISEELSQPEEMIAPPLAPTSPSAPAATPPSAPKI